MSKKFYLITILITLAIAAIIVSLFIYYKNKTQQNNATEVPKENAISYESLPIEELAKEPNLDIETSKGVVSINNVYKNPLEKLSNNGVSFADSADYYMAFYPQDSGFLITIKNSDVISAERKAEDSLLKQLEITKDQACQLKVSVTVPSSVSKKYSGGVYGFSFCSGVKHIE